MLLYKKGALFKAHQDTEKAPRMFGTLVICLPSAHKGGAVKVNHAGEEKTFRTDNIDQSYICWYADVMHEVTKITSGYRWVLTYNLIGNTPSSQSLAADPKLGVPLVYSSFIEWRDAYLARKTSAGHYCYILEHKYTEANLHLDHLKGNDRFRAQALKRLCAETKFCLFVANLEREVFGGCYEDDCPYGGPAPKHKRKDVSYGYDKGYHTIDFDEEITILLKRVVDQSGSTVAENVAIEDDDIVQRHPFRRTPDKEDHMPYWGNEGAQATHWYRNTVLVIMPRAHLPVFLLSMLRAPSPRPEYEIIDYSVSKPPIDIFPLVNRFKQEFDAHPEDQQHRNDLEFLSRGILEYVRHHMRVRENTDIAVSEVVKASAALDNIELFEEATSLINRRLEEDSFPIVGAWAVRRGFQPLRQGFQKLVSNKGRIHTRYGIIQDIVRSISTAAGCAEKMKELGVTAWMESTMAETMTGCENVCVQDGPAFVDFIKHSSDPEKTLDIVIFLAKRKLSDTPFAVAVLGNLFASAKSGDLGISSERISQPLRDIALQLISSFEMDPSREEKDPPKWSLQAPSLRGEDLASLFDLVFELQLEAEPEQLLNKIKTEAGQMNEQRPAANGLVFSTVVLPFLRRFLPVAQSHDAYWTTSRTAYHSFYGGMLNLYLKKYVGDEPMRPQDWTRAPLDCKCKLCSLHLKDFLQKPDQKWGHFRFKEDDRKHLQRTLESAHSSYNGGFYRPCREFVFETIRTGSAPHTLLVGKTETVWQEKWTEWDGRRRSAGKELLRLDAAVNLKEVLGDQYGKVMDMMDVKLPAGTNQNTPPFRATKETPGFIYSDKSAQSLRLYGSVVMEPEIEAGGTMTHAGRPKPKRPLQSRAANSGSSRASKTAGTKRTSQAPKTETKRQRT